MSATVVLMIVKRKITTVEEYDAPASMGVSKRSAWSRLADVLFGDQDALRVPPSFYRHEDKRHYYFNGTVLRSLAFSNGLLYGGCTQEGCPQRCVPIRLFEPEDAVQRGHFCCALATHDEAVAANDLEVAMENRAIIEANRAELCASCRFRDRGQDRGEAEEVEVKVVEERRVSTPALEEVVQSRAPAADVADDP